MLALQDTIHAYDPVEFWGRFPAVRDKMKRLLEVHTCLDWIQAACTFCLSPSAADCRWGQMGHRAWRCFSYPWPLEHTVQYCIHDIHSPATHYKTTVIM